MSKILFIDDEDDILNGYKKIFDSSIRSHELKGAADNFFGESFYNEIEDTDSPHYTVLTASQGIDGVNIIRESLEANSPVHIVFIDMRMPPGIDGLETAKKIRELDNKIEIVIVTAYSDVDFKRVVKEIGSPDKLLYLKKPFDGQEIKQFALNLAVKYKNELIKDDFVSNVSHELKTPLSAILGFHQLLLDVDDMPEEAKEYLGFLGYSAKLMKSLIDELFTTLEFRRSGVVLEKRPINITHFIHACFKTLEPLVLEKQGIDFNLQIDDSLISETVSMDQTKINQCINNLVTNALKFTDEGSISLRLSKENENIIITISDTGIGIPQDKLTFIFDKFSRIEDKHHEVPGLGLGLNIVKNIMDAHNAQVQVCSTPNQGSEFRLIFPRENNV